MKQKKCLNPFQKNIYFGQNLSYADQLKNLKMGFRALWSGRKFGVFFTAKYFRDLKNGQFKNVLFCKAENSLRKFLLFSPLLRFCFYNNYL